jgi:Fe2+ transport system protein FeoA
MLEYEILDIPPPMECLRCEFCMRVKLLEMGFLPGTHIRIEDSKWGINIVHILSECGNIQQSIALRTEELERICLKEVCDLSVG